VASELTEKSRKFNQNTRRNLQLAPLVPTQDAMQFAALFFGQVRSEGDHLKGALPNQVASWLICNRVAQFGKPIV
jgi:hypothetical protein